MGSNRIVRILTVSLLAFTLICFGCQKEVGAGPMAPDFSLSDLSGKKRTLSDYKNHVVILDFWATWCPPCRMTIPLLVELQEKYRKKGLVIIGISLDDPLRFTNQYLRAFKKKFRINYPILRFNNQVVKDYFGTEDVALPTMFVIDRSGKIRDKVVGYRPDALKKSLSRLIE